MIIRSLHNLDEEKLRKVRKDMQTLGVPTIRAIDDGEILWAIEGTHRLEAASSLKLPIKIIKINPQDPLPADIRDEMDYPEWTGLDLIDALTRTWQGRDYDIPVESISTM